MDSTNHPVVPSTGPIPPPEVPLVCADVSVASPEEPAAAPSPAAPSPASAARPIVSTIGSDVIGSLQSLLGTIVIAVFVITFVVQAFQIPSQSMENTLLVGDYLLVNKLCYGGAGMGDHLMPYQKISRGDIIVFHYPVDPTQHFVKRVIGVPGDHLRMISKKVWINGKPVDEPYVRFLEPPNNMFRDNFPRVDIAAPWYGGKVVAGDAEAGGGWPAHCSGGTLFCDGRQSRRQPGQPLLGLRAAGKYYWEAAADLLVGAGLGSRYVGVAVGPAVSHCVCGDAHLSDHALEPDFAADTLRGLLVSNSDPSGAKARMFCGC